MYYNLYADNIQVCMFLLTNYSPGLNNQQSNYANDLTKWLISYYLFLKCSLTFPLSSISPLNRVLRSSIHTIYIIRIRDHSYTSSYQ